MSQTRLLLLAIFIFILYEYATGRAAGVVKILRTTQPKKPYTPGGGGGYGGGGAGGSF